MARLVPCAARASSACVESIPLGDVPYRDPDAAAICGPCADALEFDPMAKKLTTDNGSTRDATEGDLETDNCGGNQEDDQDEDAPDVLLSFPEYLRRVPSADDVREEVQ